MYRNRVLKELAIVKLFGIKFPSKWLEHENNEGEPEDIGEI